MKHVMLVALLLVSLALPAAAFAQDASEGYGQVAGAAGAAGEVRQVSGGQLPFTGLEVGLVALGGALLLGGGLVLRRSQAAR